MLHKHKISLKKSFQYLLRTVALMGACHFSMTNSFSVPSLSSLVILKLNLNVVSSENRYQFEYSTLAEIPDYAWWYEIAKERGVTREELKKTTWQFAQRFHTSFTCKDLVFGRSLLLYYSSHYYELNNNQCLNLLKESADHGNENASKILLKAYQYGWYGRDKKNPEVQNEGLRLAMKYADQGSEIATEIFLSAYLNGWFGLDSNNPAVWEEGLRLAKLYGPKK